MRRKIKQIDLTELIDADDINRTSIKSVMRKLWPAIHQKLTDGGWTARDMVRWLGERGVEMSVELFRVYLRDLDREQGFERSKKEYIKKGVSPSPSRPHTQNTIEKQVVSASSKPVLPVTKTATTAGENPLRALSGKPKVGDYNPIPTAKFEVDKS